jgi:TRAP-type C4-dicarboxylate transport system substrate-binding protein
MGDGAAAVRAGGYQGERSIHTRALRCVVDALAAETLIGPIALDIDVTASGSTARALFDRVDSGVDHLCYMASSYLTARVPSLAVLDLPFSVANRHAAYDALDAEAGRMLAGDVEARTGYRVLGFWDNGFRHISNRQRPIHGLGDCRGLTIRTLDNAIYREVFTAMGFTARSIDVRDFMTAVAMGTVDAQENPLTNLLGFGIDACHPFVSLTGHFFGVALLVCHGRWFDSLSGAAQAQVLDSAARTTALQRQFAIEEDANAGAILRERGLDVLERSDIDLAGFEAACQPIRLREAARLDPALVAAYLGR